MGKLQILSGQEVCKILSGHGFVQVRQKGSHIVMQKQITNSTITVPFQTIPSLKLELYFQSSGNPDYLNKFLNLSKNH